MVCLNCIVCGVTLSDLSNVTIPPLTNTTNKIGKVFCEYFNLSSKLTDYGDKFGCDTSQIVVNFFCDKCKYKLTKLCIFKEQLDTIKLNISKIKTNISTTILQSQYDHSDFSNVNNFYRHDFPNSKVTKKGQREEEEDVGRKRIKVDTKNSKNLEKIICSRYKSQLILLHDSDNTAIPSALLQQQFTPPLNPDKDSFDEEEDEKSSSSQWDSDPESNYSVESEEAESNFEQQYYFEDSDEGSAVVSEDEDEEKIRGSVWEDWDDDPLVRMKNIYHLKTPSSNINDDDASMKSLNPKNNWPDEMTVAKSEDLDDDDLMTIINGYYDDEEDDDAMTIQNFGDNEIECMTVVNSEYGLMTVVNSDCESVGESDFMTIISDTESDYKMRSIYADEDQEMV